MTQQLLKPELDIILSPALTTVITDNESTVLYMQEFSCNVLTKYDGKSYHANNIKVSYNGLDNVTNIINKSKLIFTFKFQKGCVIGKNASITLTASANIDGRKVYATDNIQVIAIQKDERCIPQPSIDTIRINSNGNIIPSVISCNILRQFDNKLESIQLPYKNYYLKYSFSNKPELKYPYNGQFPLEPFFMDSNDLPSKLTFYLYNSDFEYRYPLETCEIPINISEYTGYYATAKVDLDNEMDSIVVNNEYQVIENQTIETNAYFYTGSGYGKINLNKTTIELNTYSENEIINLKNISIIPTLIHDGLLNIKINFTKDTVIPKKTQIAITVAGNINSSERIQYETVTFILNAVPSTYPLYNLLINTNAIKVSNNGHREPIYINCDKCQTLGGQKTHTDYGILLYSIDEGAPKLYEDKIASSDIKNYILFEYYDDYGNLLDKETVFTIYDGTNGEDGVTLKLKSTKKYYLATADTIMIPTYNDNWVEEATPENYNNNCPYLWSYEESIYEGSDGETYILRTTPTIIAIPAPEGIQGCVVRRTEFASKIVMVENTDNTKATSKKYALAYKAPLSTNIDENSNLPVYKADEISELLFFNDKYYAPSDETIRYIDIIHFKKKWFRRIVPEDERSPYTTNEERILQGKTFPITAGELVILNYIFDNYDNITTNDKLKTKINELKNDGKINEILNGIDEKIDFENNFFQYWEMLTETEPIVTPLIMAENAVLELAQGNEFLLMDNNNVVGGLSGYTGNKNIGSNVRIFVGTQIDSSIYDSVSNTNMGINNNSDTEAIVYYKKNLAPFRVLDDGTFYANNANITGDFAHLSPDSLYNVEIKNGEIIYGGNQSLSVIFTSRLCKNTPTTDILNTNVSTNTENICGIDSNGQLIYNRQFTGTEIAVIPCIAFTNTQGKVVSCIDVTGFHLGPDVADSMNIIETVMSEKFSYYSGINTSIDNTNNIHYELSDVVSIIIGQLNDYDDSSYISKKVPYDRIIREHAYNIYELNNADQLKIWDTSNSSAKIITKSVSINDNEVTATNWFNKDITLYYKLGDRNRYYIDSDCKIPALSGELGTTVKYIDTATNKEININANLPYAIEELANVTYVIDKQDFYNEVLVNWDNETNNSPSAVNENSEIEESPALYSPSVNVSTNNYGTNFNRPVYDVLYNNKYTIYDDTNFILKYQGLKTWWGDKDLKTYNKGISYGVNKTFRDVFPYLVYPIAYKYLYTGSTIDALAEASDLSISEAYVNNYPFLGHSYFKNLSFNNNHTLLYLDNPENNDYAYLINKAGGSFTDDNTDVLKDLKKNKYRIRAGQNIAYNYYNTSKNLLSVNNFFGQFDNFYCSTINPVYIKNDDDGKIYGYSTGDITKIIGYESGCSNMFEYFYYSTCTNIYKIDNKTINEKLEIPPLKGYELICNIIPTIKMICYSFKNPNITNKTFLQISSVINKDIWFINPNSYVQENGEKFNLRPNTLIGPYTEDKKQNLSKYILYREQILFENGYKKVYSTYWNAPNNWEPETDTTGIIYKRVTNFKPYREIDLLFALSLNTSTNNRYLTLLANQQYFKFDANNLINMGNNNWELLLPVIPTAFNGE